MEHKGAYGEDKFYLRPTNHVTVHGGAIPIQQPPQVILSCFSARNTRCTSMNADSFSKKKKEKRKKEKKKTR